MNALQKTQLRLSEIRAKLAEIAGTGGDLSDEQKKEMASLRTEYVDVETRHAALLVAEPEKPENRNRFPMTTETARQRSCVSSAKRWSSRRISRRHWNVALSVTDRRPNTAPHLRSRLIVSPSK